MNTSTEFRHLDNQADILAAFPIMKELRPHLQEPQMFASQVERQRDQGY